MSPYAEMTWEQRLEAAAHIIREGIEELLAARQAEAAA